MDQVEQCGFEHNYWDELSSIVCDKEKDTYFIRNKSGIGYFIGTREQAFESKTGNYWDSYGLYTFDELFDIGSKIGMRILSHSKTERYDDLYYKKFPKVESL
ncbi:hypothetical protein [Carnobacterium maltaromaticum]|uniref:hypothetical protein n=1 Tax=Carnobacterium maltaromaticum TaxID=2751 RepID=UPI001DC75B7D|nr:hypothetical protein [Carnobacterium maltaromaticum]MCC4313487.1 hypothetical protein [Carnobacterium maltaromaticum]